MRPTGLSRSQRSGQAQSIREAAREWDDYERKKAELLVKHAINTIETFNEYLEHLKPHEFMASALLLAAIVSKHHWMHVLCPGCQTVKAIDLRVVPRPTNTALTAIAESLRCEACRKQAPPPRIVRLTREHNDPIGTTPLP